MYHSLWAPKPPNPPLTTTAHNTTSNTLPSALASSPSPSLPNIRRLIDRLKWKSSLLQISHARALVTTTTTSSSSPAPQYPLQTSAATMFTLDFYEYYTLLERILVLLLSFFNIRISRETFLHTEPEHINGHRYVSSFDGQQQQQQRIKYTHRFHANVLSAFDKPSNPLYEVLGQQPVRRYLGVAKEFRNRWKEGEDGQDRGEGEGEGEGQGGKVKREMLEALGLEGMLEVIVGALERAVDVAEKEGERRSGKSSGGLWNGEVRNGNGGAVENGDCDTDMEDAPFEAVGDAMEWEGL